MLTNYDPTSYSPLIHLDTHFLSVTKDKTLKWSSEKFPQASWFKKVVHWWKEPDERIDKILEILNPLVNPLQVGRYAPKECIYLYMHLSYFNKRVITPHNQTWSTYLLSWLFIKKLNLIETTKIKQTIIQKFETLKEQLKTGQERIKTIEEGIEFLKQASFFDQETAISSDLIPLRIQLHQDILEAINRFLLLPKDIHLDDKLKNWLAKPPLSWRPDFDSYQSAIDSLRKRSKGDRELPLSLANFLHAKVKPLLEAAASYWYKNKGLTSEKIPELEKCLSTDLPEFIKRQLRLIIQSLHLNFHPKTKCHLSKIPLLDGVRNQKQPDLYYDRNTVNCWLSINGTDPHSKVPIKKEHFLEEIPQIVNLVAEWTACNRMCRLNEDGFITNVNRIKRKLGSHKPDSWLQHHKSIDKHYISQKKELYIHFFKRVKNQRKYWNLLANFCKRIHETQLIGIILAQKYHEQKVNPPLLLASVAHSLNNLLVFYNFFKLREENDLHSLKGEIKLLEILKFEADVFLPNSNFIVWIIHSINEAMKEVFELLQGIEESSTSEMVYQKTISEAKFDQHTPYYAALIKLLNLKNKAEHLDSEFEAVLAEFSENLINPRLY